MSLFKTYLFLSLLISSCWTIASAKYLDIGGDYKSFDLINRSPASIEMEWNSFFKVHSAWNEVLKDYWIDSRFVKLQDVLNDQVALCKRGADRGAQAQCINEKEEMILKDGLGQYQLFLISELAPNIVLTKDKMTIGECNVYTSDKECALNLIDEVFSDSIRTLWVESYAVIFPKLNSLEIILKNFEKYQKTLVQICKESFKEDDKERCAKHIEFSISRDQLNYWANTILDNKIDDNGKKKILSIFHNTLNKCFELPLQNHLYGEEWQRLYNYEISEYSILATDCLQQGVKQLAYLKTILSLKDNMSVLSSQIRLAPIPLGIDFENINDLDDVIFEEIIGQSQYSRIFEETSFDNLKINLEKGQEALAQDYALNYLIINFDNKQFRYFLSDARINGADLLSETDLMLVKNNIRLSLNGSEIFRRAKLVDNKKYFKMIIQENSQSIESHLKQLEWPLLENELKNAGFSENKIKEAGNIFDDYSKWAKIMIQSMTNLSDVMIDGSCFNAKENLVYNVLKCLRSDIEENHQKKVIIDLKNELMEHFPRESREYREALVEVGMIAYCYQEVSSFIPINQQWQQISNCEKIIRFNFAHNIDRAIAYSYTSLILQADWQKIDVNLDYCYSMSLMENGIVDFNLPFIKSKKNHNGRMSVLELFKSSDPMVFISAESLSTLQEDRQKLRQFLKKDLSTWPGDKVLDCRKMAKKLTFESFQEFVIMNFSGDFKRTLQNSKGEAAEFILKSLFNMEFLNLLMSIPNIDGTNKYITRKNVLSGVSNSILKLSSFMKKGFIFDRDRMKTELVVIRGQLTEFLEYVKSENRLVEASEINGFFAESSLPEFLAISFISEMLYDKFLKYIELKKADAISKLIREYPQYGDAKNKLIFVQKRQDVLKTFEIWKEQAQRLLNAHDFRRVMNINSDESGQFLIYLKKRIIPEIITNGAIGANSERDFSLLAGQIFVKDNSADGIVGVLAREYLQNILNDKKNNYWFFSDKDSWWLKRKLFNKQEAFEWDNLAKTSEGQEILDFYTRFLFLPEFMEEGLEYTVKRGREEVFKEKLEALSKKLR